MSGQLSFDTIGIEDTQNQLRLLVGIGAVMAQKYDVVVTNPPYMSISNGGGKLNHFVKKYYSNSKADLFAVFIEKCFAMNKTSGYTSMITMQSWMFLSSFEKLREIIISLKNISSLIQIGYNSFPELNSKVAQAVAFCICNSNIAYCKGTYLDLTNKYPHSFDKHKAFHIERADGEFNVSLESFLKIPGMPISYWLSEAMRKTFENGEKFEEYGKPRAGITTGENDEFLRLWFEVDYSKIGFQYESVCDFHRSNKLYIPYNKGGKQVKWYGNNEYVIKFNKYYYDILSNQGNHLPSQQYYCLKCITWSDISSGTFAARYCDSGFIFDVKGSCGFPSAENLYFTLAILNSKITPKYIESLNPTNTTQVGDLKRIPVLKPDCMLKEEINNLSQQCVSISKNNWDYYETSWDFKKHPLIVFYKEISLIEDVLKFWNNFSIEQIKQLISMEKRLNTIFINLYGLQSEISPDVEDKNITVKKGNLGSHINSFISYVVGCMFGRYSLDADGLAYTGGAWVESKYSTFIPNKDNILPITDEEYFEDDITGRFVSFIKKVYGEGTLEQNLDFIAKALGSKGNTSREIIRNHFIKDFFKDHCKIYQKHPIYWLFDSGKADGFKALIYMHRYDENTIGNLRIDYLHQIQRVYDREIARMQDTINNSTNARDVAAAEKRKEKLTKQLKETKDYDEKIAHLALARIAIDLDDGVKVNYEKVQTGTDGKLLEVLAKI